MLEHKGFAAWITIEGKMATEYAPAILQGSEAECWIASEAGKSFEINFRATKPVDESRNVMEHTSAKVYLDGIPVSCLWRCTSTPRRISSLRVSSTEKRKLLFCALTLTDEERYRDHLINGHKSYGTIHIDIWNVQSLGYTVPRTYSEIPSHVVHETSKKAGSHCIGLSEHPRNASICSEANKVWLKEKIVTFSFFYQPLGVLQAKKIAPRPVRAVPDPSPSTRRLDICDDERYRALQDEVRQLQARIHAISTLLAQTGPKRKRSHVKTEESNEPVPLKKKKVQKIKSEITDKPIMFQPGEVIDLTLDDRIRHR